MLSVAAATKISVLNGFSSEVGEKMTSHFVNWVLPLQYLVYTLLLGGLLNGASRITRGHRRYSRHWKPKNTNYILLLPGPLHLPLPFRELNIFIGWSRKSGRCKINRYPSECSDTRIEEENFVSSNSAHTVIISTSGNSLRNFATTRFKSNCRNSTECRFSASGTDNTCRSSEST